MQIPESELEFSFVRSSGPGGQNVNKVNSKAVLRWNILKSPSLAEYQRNQLLARLGQRLTNEGELIVTCDRFRDQTRNRQDCIDKLRAMIAAALLVPKPRKATRPTRSSQRKRRDTKAKLGQKKRLRRSGFVD